MQYHRDPLVEWRETIGRQLLNLDFEPLADTPFKFEFKPIINDMRIGRSSYSPGLTIRDQELVRDGDDSFAFVIADSRKLEASQIGRAIRLDRGEAVLLRVNSTGYLGGNDYFNFTSMMIPYREFLEREPRADDLLVRRINRRSEPLKLLNVYIRMLESGKFPSDDFSLATARSHIIDLAALSFLSPTALGESKEGAVLAARASAVKEYIELHFRNPDLNVASVAEAFAISPRYLQKILQCAGLSFASHVNELRLQYALQILLQRGHAFRVSDAALASGFSDISHFNRLFRARFGETPTAMRSGGKRTPLI